MNNNFIKDRFSFGMLGGAVVLILLYFFFSGLDYFFLQTLNRPLLLREDATALIILAFMIILFRFIIKSGNIEFAKGFFMLVFIVSIIYFILIKTSLVV